MGEQIALPVHLTGRTGSVLFLGSGNLTGERGFWRRPGGSLGQLKKVSPKLDIVPVARIGTDLASAAEDSATLRGRLPGARCGIPGAVGE